MLPRPTLILTAKRSKDVFITDILLHHNAVFLSDDFLLNYNDICHPLFGCIIVARKRQFLDNVFNSELFCHVY